MQIYNFRNSRARYFLLTSILLCSFLWTGSAAAAPSADLWPLWQATAEDSTQVVDHSLWDALLKRYLVTNHPTAINRFKYASVTEEDQ